MEPHDHLLRLPDKEEYPPDKFVDGNAFVYLIPMERCSGDLEQTIKEGKKYGQTFLVRQLLGLVSALQLLHNAGTAHRDIKPANILLRMSFSLVWFALF